MTESAAGPADVGAVRAVDALRETMGQLAPWNPVRRAAESVLAGELWLDAPTTFLESLARRPSRRWREQAVSAYAIGLGRLGADENQRGRVLLERIVESRPEHTVLGLLVAGCFVAWAAPYWYVWAHVLDSRANRVREAAAWSLGRIGTLQSARVLSHAIKSPRDAWASGDRPVRYAAMRALPLILARLPDHGCGNMPPDFTPACCRMLTDEHVHVPALESLRMAGERTAIPAVEQLYRSSARRPQVQDLAKETLDTLKERAAQEIARERLVRPASAPDGESVILLRPAGIGEAADRERLLRPAYAPEGLHEPDSDRQPKHECGDL